MTPIADKIAFPTRPLLPISDHILAIDLVDELSRVAEIDPDTLHHWHMVERRYSECPYLPPIGFELEFRRANLPNPLLWGLKHHFIPIKAEEGDGDLLEIAPSPAFSPHTVCRALQLLLRAGVLQIAVDPDNHRINAITETPLPSLHINIGLPDEFTALIADDQFRTMQCGYTPSEILRLFSGLMGVLYVPKERLLAKKTTKEAVRYPDDKREANNKAIVKRSGSRVLGYNAHIEYSLPTYFNYQTYEMIKVLYAMHSVAVGANLSISKELDYSLNDLIQEFLTGIGAIIDLQDLLKPMGTDPRKQAIIKLQNQPNIGSLRYLARTFATRGMNLLLSSNEHCN